MRSLFASLRSLTLPAGATSGGRIVLDGINGQINVYNTDGDLIGTFDPDGLVFRSRDFNPARIFQYDPVQNVQTIYVDDGNETAVIQLDGRTDTQGIWVIDAATGGYVHLTPDAGGSPGIEFNDASGTTGYLAMPGANGSYAQTPQVAALDIPSEIDIRVDVQTNDWTPVTYGRVIAARGPDPTGDADWTFRLRTDGKLRFNWFDTLSIDHGVDSTASPVPAGDGRLAVRVTLDTNIGGGNGEVKFYTAATIAGPWTQLGSTVTFAATANMANRVGVSVRIGSENTFGSLKAWVGKVYAAQIYSGIAGTLVANPDFTIQSAGTTSFTDSAGRDWSILGSASIVTLGTNPGQLSAGPDGDVLVNGNSIPRGLVGFAISAGNISIPANASPTAYVAGITANNIPVQAGRRYKVTASGWFDWVTGGSGWSIGDLFWFDIAVDIGAGFVELTIPGFQQFRTNVAVVGRWIVPTLVAYFDANADGTPDFQFRAKKQAGAATVTAVASENGGANPGTLAIEDIGLTP